VIHLNTITTTTKPLISNKLRYARNETQSESIRSKVSNISDNNEYDEKKKIINKIIIIIINKIKMIMIMMMIIC
jgi:hypothetical protein